MGSTPKEQKGWQENCWIGGNNLFKDLFDFDRNGTLNSLERAIEFSFLSNLLDEEKQTLIDAELDIDELNQMDEDTRRSVIENTGLDPDDFEF